MAVRLGVGRSGRQRAVALMRSAASCAVAEPSRWDTEEQLVVAPPLPLHTAYDEAEGKELLRAHSSSQLASYKRPLTHGAVAIALHKTRKPAEAMALFDWASKQPGFRHDEKTASALLGVYVKARLFKDACRLLDQDLRHICWRSRLAFSTLAAGYCYVGNMEAAILLLREMEKLGLHIDTQLHNSLLKGLCKTGRLDEAVGHYDKMLSNKDADFSSHSIVVTELCKAGRVDRAVDIMYAMIRDGCCPDLSIFNAIVEELCKLKVDVALMLVEQMIDKGCLPDVATYRSLVLGCFRSGQLIEASRIMNQMVAMGCVPDVETYTAIIDSLCKLRRVEDARELLEDMSCKGVQPETRTHNAFLRGLCKEARLDEAQRHLQKMISRSCSPDAETYAILIRSLCKECKVVDAHRLFSEMLGRGCVPDRLTYNLLIAGHCEARKLSASYHLLRQMLDKGLTPDTETSESVIHHLQLRGRMLEAKDITKRLDLP